MRKQIADDVGAAVIGLLTVIAANGIYLSGASAVIDPALAMEPFYIAMAGRPWSAIASVDPAWGPLYAVWIKPFVAVLEDPLLVYHANLQALSLLLCLLIYAFIWLRTRRAAIATVAALLFLISDLNVPMAAKVSAFALLIVLATLVASEASRSSTIRLSIASIGALAASYVRPEFYPAAVLLTIAALTRAQRRWSPVVALVLMVAAGVVFGMPLLDPREAGDRFLIAFREHFAWNWSHWHGRTIPFMDAWHQTFGDANNLLQAVLHNPSAVSRHIGDNMIGTLNFVGLRAFDHYPLVASVGRESMVRLEAALMAAIACAAIAMVVLDRRRRLIFRANHGKTLRLFGFFSLPAVIAAIVVYPVEYYLLVPAVLLLLVSVLAFELLLPEVQARSSMWGILAASVCLMVMPRPFSARSGDALSDPGAVAPASVPRMVTDTVMFVRSLPLAKPVYALAHNDGLGELLGRGFEEVKVWQRGDMSLQEYIRARQVSIILSLDPGRDSFVVTDPYWRVIHDSPETAGFLRLAVPNHPRVQVYVRRDALRGAAVF